MVSLLETFAAKFYRRGMLVWFSSALSSYIAVKTWAFRLALCLLAFSATGPAQASDSVLESMIGAALLSPNVEATGEKTYDATVLRPDELKKCLLMANRIDQSGAALDREQASISNLDDQIQETGASLQDESQSRFVDEEKLNEFNSRVEEYNVRVQERIKRVDAYNAAIDRYTELADSFQETCNGRSFYPTDLTALRPELPPAIQSYLK